MPPHADRISGDDHAGHAATLRGRPRGRLRAMTTP
jgi:hypothetical protein